MAAQKALGIVIGKNDFQEFDEIVTIYTRYAIVSLIARGTRKITSKNRFALQLGNYIEIEYFKARLANKLSKLKRATVVSQPPINKNDVANVLFTILQTIQGVTKPSAKLFYALINANSFFGYEFNHQIKTFVLFQYLDALGIMPTYNQCIVCHRHDQIVDFDFFQGGYICSLHAKHEKSLEYLKAVQTLCQADMESFIKTSALTNQEIFKELFEYIKSNTFN